MRPTAHTAPGRRSIQMQIRSGDPASSTPESSRSAKRTGASALCFIRANDTIGAASMRLGSLFRNPFSFLFTRSSSEERVAAYLIREHDRGRSVDEILEDPYVRNRCTPQQRARILERPEVIHALGDAIAAEARGRFAS